VERCPGESKKEVPTAARSEEVGEELAKYPSKDAETEERNRISPQGVCRWKTAHTVFKEWPKLHLITDQHKTPVRR